MWPDMVERSYTMLHIGRITKIVYEISYRKGGRIGNVA